MSEGKNLLVIVSVISFVVVGVVGAGCSANDVDKQVAEADDQQATPESREGWSGKAFILDSASDGQLTSCGDRYNSKDLAAAIVQSMADELPCGSNVRVLKLDETSGMTADTSVQVRVVDTFPDFVPDPDRKLGLSAAAAERLGFNVTIGVVGVHFELVKPEG